MVRFQSHTQMKDSDNETLAAEQQICLTVMLFLTKAYKKTPICVVPMFGVTQLVYVTVTELLKCVSDGHFEKP